MGRPIRRDAPASPVRYRRCIDCTPGEASSLRDAPYPGPRCVTHHRKKIRANKLRAHARRMEAEFSITDEQYWAIYAFQHGRCFICQKATGKSKRLAVDHDHKKCSTHPPNKGCPKCIRALLCSRCNKLVAYLDADALARAIKVLEDPPAQQVLNRVRYPV